MKHAGWILSFLAALVLTVPPSAALAQKETSPTADFQLIKAGSLIIAMDNDKQNVGSVFNVASYGLAVDLLSNSIPVKWAIRTGKSKDGSDFSATVARFAPSAQAQTSLTFSGGPLIVEESYATLARARIAAFGRNVAVYELRQDTQVDIRYELLFKPRPFVNNKNSDIVTSLLINAGISAYTVGPDFALENSSCYTIIMEPHNAVTTGVGAIASFVETGGNFYAQCESVEAFENAGKFMSTGGFDKNAVGTALNYPSPDLSFSQFIGAINPAPVGSVTDWFLLAGSIFKSGVTSHAESGSGATLRYQAMQRKTISGNGGLVFYVGGHDHAGTTLDNLNAQRLMFNAILTPSRRPSVCNIQPLEIPVSDITISKAHSGAYMSGTSGTYSFTIGNIGNRNSVDDIVVTDTLAAGLTFNSGSGSGWTFASTVIAGGRVVVTATYAASLPIGGSTTFSINVGIGSAAVGTRVNTAHVVGGGEVNLTNNISSVSVNIVGMSGRVFEDFGTIGTFDGSDLPLAGLTVNIVNNGVTYTTTTDAQGIWTIAGLFPNTTATVTIPTTGGNTILAGATQSVGTNPSDHAVGSSGTAAGGDDGFRILANLSVAKTGPALAPVSDTIQYVITTTNLGPNPALSVIVTDTLPALGTFVYASRGGVVSGNVITWPSATVAVNGTLVDTVRIMAPPNATTLLNIAAATTVRVDTDATNNNGSQSASRVSTVLQIPDLTILKRSPSSFTQGVNAAYTIVVRNVSGVRSSGTITVSDTLPSGVAYVSTAAVVGSWSFSISGNAVTGSTTGSLAASDSAVFSITVTPLASGVPSVTNKAVVSNPNQINLANDTAYVTTPIGGLVDLTITKSAPSAPFTEYASGTYRVRLNNIGTAPSSGTILVVDTLVAGTTFISGTGVGWTISAVGQVVTATYTGSIAIADSAFFTLTVAVGNVATTIGNTARVSGGGDSNAANNTSTIATAVTQVPNLSLTKTSSTFTVGQKTATYTIVVSNAAGAATSTVPITVVDTLPVGVKYLSNASSGNNWTKPATYDSVTRVVTATYNAAIGAGTSSESLILTVEIQAAAFPSVNNTARVSGGGDTTPGNNSGSVTTPVVALDLAITKTSASSFSIGSLIDKAYTFNVTNLSPGAALLAGDTIRIVDTLPVNVTALAQDGSTDWTLTYNPATRVMIAFHTKAVAVGGSTQPLQVDVTFSAGTPPSVTNTARVSAAGEVNLTNNTSSVTTPVSGVDLAIAKTSSALFTPGTTGLYTLTVTNVGTTATAGTYTVVDTLPANLTLTSVTTPQNGWTVSVATPGTRAIVTATRTTSLAAAASTSFTVTPTVTAAAMPSVYNKAYVSGGGQLTSPANDTSSVITPVASPDLTLSKVAAGPFEVAANAGYTFTVTNVGTYLTSGSIIVTDTLPAGLTYHQAGTSGTGWTFSNSGQVVTATFTGTLAASASTSFTLGVIVGQAAAPSVTNVARVSGGNDQNIANNIGGPVTTTVGGQADLAVTKTSTTANFIYGGAGSYTIQVSNVGNLPTSATITVRDTLAAGMTFVSGSGTNWTVTHNAGVITATNPGPIGAGASSSFTINVTVGVAATSVVNVARVAGGGQLNLANDSSRAMTTIVAPDLTLAKVATGIFETGGTGTYQLTVTNIGTAPAGASIVVTDTLPAGLTFVSGSGTGWVVTATGQVVTSTYSGTPLDPATGVTSFTIAVAVGAAALPQVVNTARVAGGGEYNNTNNTAGPVTTLVGGQSDLTISKVGASSFQRGANASYTITVTNAGTIATSGTITVTDTLPGSLSFVSGAGTGWVVSAVGGVVTGTYTGVPLAAGGASTSFTLTVSVSIGAGESVTNTAYVAGGGEVNTSNDSSTVTISLGGTPNITIVKSVLPATNVIPGSVLTYSISFTNGGNAPALNVIVTDDLPVQLQFKVSSIVQVYPAGITATTEYFNGTVWTYTPVSGGCGALSGYDGCITKIRWMLQSAMPQVTNGTISFQARVR